MRRGQLVGASFAGLAAAAIGVAVLTVSATAGPTRAPGIDQHISAATGRPASVPKANWIGNSPVNPNSIPSTVVPFKRGSSDWSPPGNPNGDIPAATALADAWEQLGPAARPQSATAMLVSSGGQDDWVVTYDLGACVSGPLGGAPDWQPSPYAGPCGITIVLDAATGEFISAS